MHMLFESPLKGVLCIRSSAAVLNIPVGEQPLEDHDMAVAFFSGNEHHCDRDLSCSIY